MRSVLVHSFRPTIFSAERQYELHDGTLRWADGKGQRSVPLRDIAAVRIYRQPSGMGQTIRRTVLRLWSGEKIVLQSTHYARLGVIEDRAASYRAFAGALLEQLVAANPQVKIVLGHSWPLWTVWLVILIGAVVVLAGSLLMFLALDFPLAALFYVAVIVAFLPAAWRIVRRGRPRPGNPQALPANILD